MCVCVCACVGVSMMCCVGTSSEMLLLLLLVVGCGVAHGLYMLFVCLGDGLIDIGADADHNSLLLLSSSLM